MRPVDDKYPVSLPYGAPGHYIAGYHTGVDFACPIGTPIVAPQAGRVITSAYSEDDYGHYVMLVADKPFKKGESPRAFLMAHMSKRLVSVGDIVKRGQVIGYSGDTGNATGPHCHAERRHAPYGYRDHEKPPWK